MSENQTPQAQAEEIPAAAELNEAELESVAGGTLDAFIEAAAKALIDAVTPDVY